jgi:hypothetical protein
MRASSDLEKRPELGAPAAAGRSSVRGAGERCSLAIAHHIERIAPNQAGTEVEGAVSKLASTPLDPARPLGNTSGQEFRRRERADRPGSFLRRRRHRSFES